MNNTNFSQLLVILALLAFPFVLTSCDDDAPWHYADDPWYWGGSGGDDNGNTADQMVSLLSGRWQGNMMYTYTSENARPGQANRVTEKYAVDMTFYRSEDERERYAGQGVEVDRNEQGDTQVLNFTWWIDTQNGDIYLKYSDSNSIFRMDATSTNRGYHLGWEISRNAYTFYGYLIGQSNDDEIYIDLERADGPRKVLLGVDTQSKGALSFGKAIENDASKLSVNVISRIHRR